MKVKSILSVVFGIIFFNIIQFAPIYPMTEAETKAALDPELIAINPAADGDAYTESLNKLKAVVSNPAYNQSYLAGYYPAGQSSNSSIYYRLYYSYKYKNDKTIEQLKLLAEILNLAKTKNFITSTYYKNYVPDFEAATNSLIAFLESGASAQTTLNNFVTELKGIPYSSSGSTFAANLTNLLSIINKPEYNEKALTDYLSIPKDGSSSITGKALWFVSTCLSSQSCRTQDNITLCVNMLNTLKTKNFVSAEHAVSITTFSSYLDWVSQNTKINDGFNFVYLLSKEYTFFKPTWKLGVAGSGWVKFNYSGAGDLYVVLSSSEPTGNAIDSLKGIPYSSISTNSYILKIGYTVTENSKYLYNNRTGLFLGTSEIPIVPASGITIPTTGFIPNAYDVKNAFVTNGHYYNSTGSLYSKGEGIGNYWIKIDGDKGEISWGKSQNVGENEISKWIIPVETAKKLQWIGVSGSARFVKTAFTGMQFSTSALSTTPATASTTSSTSSVTPTTTTTTTSTPTTTATTTGSATTSSTIATTTTATPAVTPTTTTTTTSTPTTTSTTTGSTTTSSTTAATTSATPAEASTTTSTEGSSAQSTTTPAAGSISTTSTSVATATTTPAVISTIAPTSTPVVATTPTPTESQQPSLDKMFLDKVNKAYTEKKSLANKCNNLYGICNSYKNKNLTDDTKNNLFTNILTPIYITINKYKTPVTNVQKSDINACIKLFNLVSEPKSKLLSDSQKNGVKAAVTIMKILLTQKGSTAAKGKK